MTTTDASAVLEVHDLHVTFSRSGVPVRAVKGVSFSLKPGEVLGIVGESGSGKSAAARAMMGLIGPTDGVHVSGSVMQGGAQILGLTRRQLRKYLGREISMIFQDPMSSLNPVRTIGSQLVETIRSGGYRRGRAEARSFARELLEGVGLDSSNEMMKRHAHQLSGGMRQRVMIALAMANAPQVLIADEPTTALDVTIQRQVLAVLRRVVSKSGTGLVLITHDLGVIAEVADRVAVMYAGRIVEMGQITDVFDAPRHPYTVGLMASSPSLGKPGDPMYQLQGSPPDPRWGDRGCAFLPRCELAAGRVKCEASTPPLSCLGHSAEAHGSACHFAPEVSEYVDGLVLELGTDFRDPVTGTDRDC